MIERGCSIAFVLAAFHACQLDAQEMPAPSRATADFVNLVDDRIPKPTLGGSQFWGDVHVFHDWRIQQRVGQDKYRLLDPREFAHQEGSFAECIEKLERIKQDHQLEPMRGRAVILLHGLVATRWTMRLLADHLASKGGYTVINVEYPSTRQSIAEHAKCLARVVDGLPKVEQLNFIGHSMGNIVIRHYLADVQKRQGHQDPRLGRVVMIAPPNHGSRTATRWSDNSAFKSLFGRSGRQLGKEWIWLETDLIAPPCQFGIIAGGLGGGGFSPFLPGDDDGRIAVTTTRLAGAHDFVVVPMIHEFIANDPRTFAYVLKFLDAGHFVAADQRQPIHEGPAAEMARRPRWPSGNGPGATRIAPTPGKMR